MTAVNLKLKDSFRINKNNFSSNVITFHSSEFLKTTDPVSAMSLAHLFMYLLKVTNPEVIIMNLLLDHRPEKVGQSHGESTEEVKAFLKQRGLTLDEFEEMKNLSTMSKSQTQLNEVPGGQSLPKVPEVPTISGVRGAYKQEEEIAKNLAANLIRAKSSKGRKVTAVLKNQEDIDVAKYLMKKLRDCLEKKADKNTENVAMDFEVNHGDNDALTPHLTRDLTKKEGRMILEKKYGPLTPLDYLRLFTKENKYIRYQKYL